LSDLSSPIGQFPPPNALGIVRVHCDAHSTRADADVDWSCSDDVSRDGTNERRSAPDEAVCKKRSDQDEAHLSDHFTSAPLWGTLRPTEWIRA